MIFTLFGAWDESTSEGGSWGSFAAEDGPVIRGDVGRDPSVLKISE